jgi:hypothetical protein
LREPDDVADAFLAEQQQAQAINAHAGASIIIIRKNLANIQ